jgi:hypothetical protein
LSTLWGSHTMGGSARDERLRKPRSKGHGSTLNGAATRRFESEPSASSPKRSGGLSSRTCRRSCFVHDAATRVNPSSAAALIATADSATAAIFAGGRRGRNNGALLTGATRRQCLVEKPTNYVSAPIGAADAGLA